MKIQSGHLVTLLDYERYVLLLALTKIEKNYDACIPCLCLSLCLSESPT